MQISKAARRYATALLQLAIERDEVQGILNDVQFIRNTLQDSRDLTLFLRSPIINRDDKHAVLEKLFREEVQELTYLFLKLMARKDRENLLEQIVEAFVDKYNEYAGIIKIDAYVAQDLSDDQATELKNALEKETQKKVDLKIKKDTSLKGGLAVRIKDTVIDGTVKHKINQLESLFSESTV